MNRRELFELFVVLMIMITPALIIVFSGIGLARVIELKKAHFVLQGLYVSGLSICTVASVFVSLYILSKVLK